MRYAVNIAALALTVVVSACASGGKEQGFTRADQETIRRNAVELAAAFNSKQLDKVLAFYADNSVFMPPNAPLLRGREPLMSFYTDLIGRGASDLRLEPEEVSGHGPMAYASGTYSVSFANGASRDRGKYLLVLRNTAGHWRTEKTIWSSDLPPANASAN